MMRMGRLRCLTQAVLPKADGGISLVLVNGYPLSLVALCCQRPPTKTIERKIEMTTATRTALTPLDLCTLIAHETVSLLNADAEALGTTAQLREGLTVLAATKGLTDDAGDLLTWVDQEAEAARRFTATGTDAPHLIDPDSLLPTPDAATQLEMILTLFQTSVDLPQEQRRILLDTARTLTEMGGLEDMLLTANAPAAGSLTAEDLQIEREDVRAALQTEPVTE